MGVRNSKEKDLLEGSAWLRTVVQHYQKRRQGVAGFDSFTIDPVFGKPKSDIVKKSLDDEVRQFRVDIIFRNNKGSTQEVYWIVKAAYASNLFDNDICSVSTECRSVERLYHEIKVYTQLLVDIGKFLESRKNPRARFLLNIPCLVFQERAQRAGRVARCHLVVEDVTRTKRCTPLSISRLECGMTLAQFKVFLGTIAQFHAVGLCWNSAKKDDSILDLFPFLHRQPSTSYESTERREVYLSMYNKLLLWYFGDGECRQVRLFRELKTNAEKILSTDLHQDMCDPLGGLCTGFLLPTEVLFQYETTFASLFNLCKNLDSKTDDYENRNPVCAAVATCHRIHFGHLLRELATLFFIMPEPLVRRWYLVLMIQSYCHVLTLTMEMLEVDWFKHFKMTFHQVVEAFYREIPQAILRATIAHMKLTDPQELDKVVSSDRDKFETVSKDILSLQDESNTQRRKNIPLTKTRVEFLISLLDSIPKPI